MDCSKNVPEDLHVDQFGGPCGGRFPIRRGRRAVLVGGEPVQTLTNLVGHLQTVQHGVGGEQAAVVALDAKSGVALVHRPEQPPEVLPDRPRVERVRVAVSPGNDAGRQQAAILAKGDKQHPVEEFLGRGQQLGGGNVGVVTAQRLEGPAAQLGILAVVSAGEFLADAVRVGKQVVEVTMTGRGDEALGAEEEEEAPEGGLVVGQSRSIETLEGELVVPLVVKPQFLQVGDQIPVAAEVDGVVEGLVDGRQLAAAERPVERVARAFAFQRSDIVRFAAGRRKTAEARVGELAVNLDGGLALEGIGRATIRRPGVAEQAAKHVGQESRQQFGLFHPLGLL